MTIYNREDFNTALPQLEKRITELERQNGVDYIVDEGESGIWTYRKWNSGMAECWGVYSYTSSTSTVWASPIYAADGADEQAYPFTFKRTPLEWASLESSINACWLYKEVNSHNTASHTGKYRPCKVNSFDNSLQTFEIRYYVNGMWK